MVRLWQWVRLGLFFISVALVLSGPAGAAPYAALVMDMRSGEVLHSENADTRLHPASLTKMMTLYLAFQAVEHGELTMDTVITVSNKAASEPPSKLGLRAGQKIKLRYLVRAASVKSANDAATAIGEAIAGSEAAFARRMNRTAKALGMTRTTFKNAHGLTEEGHLSTARDMTLLGRHLFFDYPEYYNLFSRMTTDAGMREVANTNRRFLGSYKGADGIKTGYTRAAGFNLVASAERGSERIIATMFGGRSSAQRNEQVSKLLDLGFKRAPTRVALRKPAKPAYDSSFREYAAYEEEGGAGKTIRLIKAPSKSPFPVLRPGPASVEPPEEMLVAMAETIAETVTAVTATVAKTPPALPETALAPPPMKPDFQPVSNVGIDAGVEVAMADVASDVIPEGDVVEEVTENEVAFAPVPRPDELMEHVEEAGDADEAPVVVERLSTSGDRHWGINVGRYPTEFQAERVLLQTALTELGTLDEALRKVKRSSQGFDANFVGMTQDGAALACRRLVARNIECATLGPAS
ncbi:serine hydrolase [Pseudoruegeria sp. HB172150]|uniref:serine hydrolase n=1 Tax=Pseudoruegeria sp. HB172150 TaxID=2721164 RepID=UPI001557D62A|nr:serine hydrolase [Pseudoruegeria sp. HB172150]